MTTERQRERFEHLGAIVLRVGVWTSSVLLVVGLGFWAAGVDPWAGRVLDTGLLILMATPAARVLVLLAEYTYTRDWFSVATTLGVIAVLVFTLISALAVR